MLLEIHGARKEYRSLRGRRTVALDGVDFAAGSGEIVGLVGPNGAGKSTLLLAAAGLLRLDAGSVICGGADPLLQTRIGYAPERVAYQQTETVLDVLRGFAIARGFTGAAAARAAAAAAAEVALSEHTGKRIAALSRGMVQRLNLAQAMLGDPRLLLLDETLSGVDPVVHHAICNLIAELPRRGTAVVLSSHDLAAVEELATRVVVMNGGVVRGVLQAGDYRRAGSLRARFLELLDVRSERRLRATAG